MKASETFWVKEFGYILHLPLQPFTILSSIAIMFNYRHSLCSKGIASSTRTWVVNALRLISIFRYTFDEDSTCIWVQGYPLRTKLKIYY